MLPQAAPPNWSSVYNTGAHHFQLKLSITSALNYLFGSLRFLGWNCWMQKISQQYNFLPFSPGLISSTVSCNRPYSCSLFKTRKAYAHLGVLVFMNLQCSLCRVVRSVPVCPTYARLQVWHLNLQMTLCSYLGGGSLGSLTKYHIVFSTSKGYVERNVPENAGTFLTAGLRKLNAKPFVWLSAVVSFCGVTCLCVTLRLNLYMVCGKKPLLIAIGFMMATSSFLCSSVRGNERTLQYITPPTTLRNTNLKNAVPI